FSPTFQRRGNENEKFVRRLRTPEKIPNSSVAPRRAPIVPANLAFKRQAKFNRRSASKTFNTAFHDLQLPCVNIPPIYSDVADYFCRNASDSGEVWYILRDDCTGDHHCGSADRTT